MPGLMFVAIGIGALVGALVTYLMGSDAHRAVVKASVGAALPPALSATKPPIAYVGDPVFSLPQRRWGQCECVTRGPKGWRYGVRFKNGQAVALDEKEVVR